MGETEKIISITALPDNIVESDKSFGIRLLNGDGYNVPGNANEATMNLIDNDVNLSFNFNDLDGSQESISSTEVTATLSEALSEDLTVYFTPNTMSSSATQDLDFTMTGSLIISAGETTGTMEVAITNDDVMETNETIALMIDTSQGNGGFSGGSMDANRIFVDPDVKTYTIIDEDTATLSLSVDDGSFTDTNDNDGTTATHTYTLQLDNGKTLEGLGVSVTLSTSGTAELGSDYEDFTNTTYTINGNSLSFEVTLYDDAVIEADSVLQTAIKSVSNTFGDRLTFDPNSTSNITITDADAATLSLSVDNNSFTDTNANSGSEQRTYTLQLTDWKTLEGFDVDLSTSGTAELGSDYEDFTNSTYTINGNSLNLAVTLLDDAMIEESSKLKTAIGTVSNTFDGRLTVDATTSDIAITDADAATLSISTTNHQFIDTNTNDGARPTLHYTLALSEGKSIENPINITLSTTGTTAQIDSDYFDFTQSNYEFNGNHRVIGVQFIDNAIVESDALLKTQISSVSEVFNGRISFDSNNSSNIEIIDQDRAFLSIVANDTVAIDPNTDIGAPINHGSFHLQLSKVSNTTSSFQLAISGTAQAGIDYEALTNMITFSPFQQQQVLALNIIDENPGAIWVEQNEFVSVRLASTISADKDVSISNHLPSTESSIVIQDQDTSTLSVTVKDPEATEPSDQATFSLQLSNPIDTDTYVQIVVTGDALEFRDYEPIQRTIRIPAGETVVDITISTIDNDFFEDPEQLNISASILLGDKDLRVSEQNTASIIIYDDDFGEPREEAFRQFDNSTFALLAKNYALASDSSYIDGVEKSDFNETNISLPSTSPSPMLTGDAFNDKFHHTTTSDEVNYMPYQQKNTMVDRAHWTPQNAVIIHSPHQLGIVGSTSLALTIAADHNNKERHEEEAEAIANSLT